MNSDSSAEVTWRKSSYSTGQNDCVEVAYTKTGVLIRDSENRERGCLVVSPGAWTALLRRMEDGELA